MKIKSEQADEQLRRMSQIVLMTQKVKGDKPGFRVCVWMKGTRTNRLSLA